METTTKTTKKITLATVKSFIKKNEGKLLIKMESRFSGMSDMVEYHKGAAFTPATKTTSNIENTLGVEGAWVVGSSRDMFTAFETETMIGIDVYNCCGSFIIAINK